MGFRLGKTETSILLRLYEADNKTSSEESVIKNVLGSGFAVSKAIAKSAIERLIGKKLIIRKSKKLMITEKAEAIIEIIR